MQSIEVDGPLVAVPSGLANAFPPLRLKISTPGPNTKPNTDGSEAATRLAECAANFAVWGGETPTNCDTLRGYN